LIAEKIAWRGELLGTRSTTTDRAAAEERTGAAAPRCNATSGLAGRNQTGEKKGDALGGRNGPLCYVFSIPFSSRTAAPDRLRHRCTGSGKPPRRTNAGPVRRGAFEQDYNPARHSQAEWEPTSQWPRAASWLWSSLPRDRTGANRGHLGTGGSCIGKRVRAARCPRSFGPLLQSIPRPWGVMEYRNGLGATTPTRMEPERPEEKIVKIWRYDAPQGRRSRAGEGFSPVVSHA
jgi:hypothetical protein